MWTWTNKVKPVVIWISGAPGHGKSSLSKLLPQKPFSTDRFVVALPKWCEDVKLCEVWERHGSRRIGEFLDWSTTHGYSSYIAGKMLDESCGFVPNETLSVIEGYTPVVIQNKVAAALEVQGCIVWFAMRFDQYNIIKGVRNWR
jgi:hypothetical protein